MRPEAVALLVLSLVPLVVLVPRAAHADPQISTALSIGGGAVGLEAGGRAVPAFHLGGRADVLFLRTRDREMGIGPYLELGSEAFHSFEVGGGVDWLIPASVSFPFILSAGVAERHTAETGWEPGVAGSLFFGSRGYNFDSMYDLTLGLFVQTRYSLGASHDTDVIGGLQVDFALLAFPALYIYNALK